MFVFHDCANREVTQHSEDVIHVLFIGLFHLVPCITGKRRYVSSMWLTLTQCVYSLSNMDELWTNEDDLEM